MPDQELTLEALGWSPALEAQFAAYQSNNLQPGRVAVEDKHYYTVLTAAGDLIAQVSGKLLHETENPAALPKVGDWVAVAPQPNEAKAVIHHVLPRRTKLSRKVAGREIEEQVLAANIDVAFVVQALDDTFNPALLQRHIVMVFESGAKPVAILNKADLCSDLAPRVTQAECAAPGVPVVVVSAKTQAGVAQLQTWIRPTETVVFIGSSGVGKSSLINDLYGDVVQATTEVRERDSKGRHTTTWRELIILPNGALVIDTPGMREFQMWVANEGMREAFTDLETLANQCRFRDCTHTAERGCAVLEALASGQLARERYNRFVKLQRELRYLQEAQRMHSWTNRRRQVRGLPRANSRGRRQRS
jgi:ribosome biogenesis GTPase